MNTIEFLQTVRRELTDPERFVIGDVATDARGRSTTVHHGVRHCTVGKCRQLYLRQGDRDVLDRAYAFLIDASQEISGIPDIGRQNDRGHESALRMIDRAIELAMIQEGNPQVVHA